MAARFFRAAFDDVALMELILELDQGRLGWIVPASCRGQKGGEMEGWVSQTDCTIDTKRPNSQGYRRPSGDRVGLLGPVLYDGPQRTKLMARPEPKPKPQAQRLRDLS